MTETSAGAKPYLRETLLPKKFFSHSITITGETGVGTSSLLKELQKILGMPWRFVSGGSIMREYAKQQGMSIEDFAAECGKDSNNEYDRACDTVIREFGEQNFLVVEGRMPHVFVPRAFHVLLVCDLKIRAIRRVQDELHKSPNFILAEIRQRDNDDYIRYNKMYPGCRWSEQDFDLILDSGIDGNTPSLLARRIVDDLEEWRSRKQLGIIGKIIHSVTLE